MSAATTASGLRSRFTPSPYPLAAILDAARGAEVVDDADRTARGPSDANSPPVPDEQMWEARPVILRDEALKVALDLDGIVPAGEAQALRQPTDVRVDDHALRRAPLRGDDVRRLPPHSGQPDEL